VGTEATDLARGDRRPASDMRGSICGDAGLGLGAPLIGVLGASTVTGSGIISTCCTRVGRF
jgi:hypothetical protein